MSSTTGPCSPPGTAIEIGFVDTPAARVPWYAKVLAACVVAYASDLTMLDTTLLPHGVGWAEDHLMMASLDHAMWFHRPFRADDWLLYAQDSPSAFGSRGFCRGSVFTRDGLLVASTTQEGLMRRQSTQYVVT